MDQAALWQLSTYCAKVKSYNKIEKMLQDFLYITVFPPCGISLLFILCAHSRIGKAAEEPKAGDEQRRSC